MRAVEPDTAPTDYVRGFEHDRAIAKLAEAEARLDYLESHCRRDGSTIRIGTEMHSCTAWAISSAPGRSLRETIDAARQSAQAAEGGKTE